MSVALLRKFFELAKAEDKKCSICLDNVDTFDKAYITFNCCAYIFHSECIKQSFNQVNNHCPICNETLLIKDTFTTSDTESNCESECSCESFSQNEIFLINFTNVYACTCTTCTLNNFYYKLKFSIENDDLDEFYDILDELDLDLDNYNPDYVDKIFLFAIENNSYSIMEYLINNEGVYEYPETEKSNAIFKKLADTKNYKMIRYLADFSLESLPILIGYENDPELLCILEY